MAINLNLCIFLDENTRVTGPQVQYNMVKGHFQVCSILQLQALWNLRMWLLLIILRLPSNRGTIEKYPPTHTQNEHACNPQKVIYIIMT